MGKYAKSGEARRGAGSHGWRGGEVAYGVILSPQAKNLGGAPRRGTSTRFFLRQNDTTLALGDRAGAARKVAGDEFAEWLAVLGKK